MLKKKSDYPSLSVLTKSDYLWKVIIVAVKFASMEDSNVHNVAQAIATALNWSSTPDARQQALSFLDSVISSL